jgi:hypothetical protein
MGGGIGIDYATASAEGEMRGFHSVAGGDHIIHKPDWQPQQWSATTFE